MADLKGEVVNIERAGWNSVYLHVYIPEYGRSLDGTRVFDETIVFREIEGELNLYGGVNVGDKLTLSATEVVDNDEGEMIYRDIYSIISKDS